MSDRLLSGIFVGAFIALVIAGAISVRSSEHERQKRQERVCVMARAAAHTGADTLALLQHFSHCVK